MADELFASNSVIGLRAVAELDGLAWDAHPLMEALFMEYQRDALA